MSRIRQRIRERGAASFRLANPSSDEYVLLKTGVQIVFVWGSTLGLLPLFISRIERALGISRLRLPGRRTLGATLFIGGSALGLASAWNMARVGKGTPLPLDAARHLVVVGPYRVVRNPMAVAGVSQSIGVALLRGSFLGLVGSWAGATFWNIMVRPAEEDFLEQQFGNEFRAYRDAVRCWVPRWPPYDVATSGLAGEYLGD